MCKNSGNVDAVFVISVERDSPAVRHLIEGISRCVSYKGLNKKNFIFG